MLSLLYRIAGDVNPLRQSLKEGEKAAKVSGGIMGKEIGGQLKASVMRYIGAGAILGELSKLAEKSSKILSGAAERSVGVEAFQELALAAEKSGLSIEQIQNLARELPVDFAKMMDGIRQGGGIIPEDEVRRFAEIKATMNEIQGVAGKIFSSLWGGGKALAMGAANALHVVSGKIAQGISTPGSRLNEAGRFLENTGNIGFEQMFSGTPMTSTGPSTAEAFGTKGSAKLKSDAFWESIGGNEDWSMQSRQVKAKMDDKYSEDQLQATKESNKLIRELINTMR